jgi:hypothetical protein
MAQNVGQPSRSRKPYVTTKVAALEPVVAVSTSGSFDFDPALADLLAPILLKNHWERYAWHATKHPVRPG